MQGYLSLRISDSSELRPLDAHARTRQRHTSIIHYSDADSHLIVTGDLRRLLGTNSQWHSESKRCGQECNLSIHNALLYMLSQRAPSPWLSRSEEREYLKYLFVGDVLQILSG